MFFPLIFFDRVLPFAPVIIQVLPALDLREVHAVLDAGAVVEAQQLLTTHILPHGHWPGLQFTALFLLRHLLTILIHFSTLQALLTRMDFEFTSEPTRWDG